MSSRTSRALRSAAAVVLGSLALTACGGDEGGGGGGGTSSGELTGDPVLLGSILTITNPAWDNSSVQTVNEAWASYINEELGGIDGRPVQVETCDDRGDPAGTSQCLRNLIDEGVVAFVNNSSLAFGVNALPAMEQAGMVNLGGWPITPAEFSSDSNHPTTPGASGSYPSLVVYARLSGAEKLAVVCTNTPAGQGVCDSMKGLWESIGGGDYFSTLFDPSAPDFTPVMSQVAGEDPEAIVLAVGEGPAPRMFQAADVAGVDGQLLATSTAATQNVFDAAGQAVDGTLFSFATVPAEYDSEDAATYREVMETYAPDQGLTNQTAVAASSMQYAYELLSSIEGDITAESVKAAVEGFQEWDGFLTHPMDPGTAPENMPAISNPYNLVAQYEGGEFTPVEIDDPGELGPYIDEQGDLVWIAGTPVGSS